MRFCTLSSLNSALVLFLSIVKSCGYTLASILVFVFKIITLIPELFFLPLV